MVVTVSSSDPRSVKALALLATSDRWIKAHRKEDGRAFFVVPGNGGRVYWTDCSACTCPDFARNAPQERGFACKHVLAVRMWKLARDGQGTGKARGTGKGEATPPTPPQTPRMAQDMTPDLSRYKVCASCGALFNPAIPGDRCCECGGPLTWEAEDADAAQDVTVRAERYLFPSGGEAPQVCVEPEDAADSPTPVPSCVVCGDPLPRGRTMGTCDRDTCYDTDVWAMFEGVAGIRAALGADQDAIIRTVRA
jgi:predicted nucleic acid-binding Zn finger protein